MRASDTWRFSARLHASDTATVVRRIDAAYPRPGILVPI